jgi:exo-beta-1,3-glucanase (GH17 family)
MLTYDRDSIEPNCNQTLSDTIVDMQLLSQLTTRIRLYSTECNQTALVLEAIKQTKTDIKIYPAIYLVDVDEAGYQRQKTALQQALQTYGTSNILGITVGNEVMLNYMLDKKATDINGTVGLAASALLKTKITDIRQLLTSMSINLPVGTADAASFFNTDLLSALDFGCAFIHSTMSKKRKVC